MAQVQVEGGGMSKSGVVRPSSAPHFYHLLDEVNKEAVNNLEAGSFMNLTYFQASTSLNQIAKIYMAWHTRDRAKSSGGSVSHKR